MQGYKEITYCLLFFSVQVFASDADRFQRLDETIVKMKELSLQTRPQNSGVNMNTIMVVYAVVLGGMYLNEYFWEQDKQKLQSYQKGGDFDKKLSFDELVALLDQKIPDRLRVDDVDIRVIARMVQESSYGKVLKFIDLVYQVAHKDKQVKINKVTFDQAYQLLHFGRFCKENTLKWFDRTLHHFLNHGTFSRKNIALHEAGHAVVNVLEVPFKKVHAVTIEDLDGLYGLTSIIDLFANHEWELQDISDFIGMLLAGGITEQIYGYAPKKYGIAMFDDVQLVYDYFGSVSRLKGDFENVKKLFSYIVYRDETQRKEFEDELLLEIYQDVYELILEYKAEIEILADHLMQKGTISGDEVYEILGVEQPLFDFEREENGAAV